MRILVVSDLHLEYSMVAIDNTNDYDVLILSGDIGIAASLNITSATGDRYAEFLQHVSTVFPNVIYVLGNHEFYHGSFFESIDVVKSVCEKFGNVHVLENDYVKIDDVVFVGATLWTDCNRTSPLTMMQLPSKLADYRAIRNDRENRRALSTTDTVARHNETVSYFNNTLTALKEKGETRIVIATHHAPSTNSIHEQYADEYIMNGGFASNLEELILKYPEIKLWTHGHMHSTFDYYIGDTRVVCNPRGYQSTGYSEPSGWDPSLLIEL